MLNKEYWENRYEQNEIGWDIGHVSTPIKAYIDQLENKHISILIPGAGLCYEAEYAHKLNFSNIHVIEFAAAPLDSFKKRCHTFPREHIHEQDFFDHQDQYDVIIEQTFFCALNPNLRQSYLQKIKSLLKSNGKYLGLLFDMPLTDQGPPFGGTPKYYKELLSMEFQIVKLEKCHNSIKPRQGSEIWFSVIPLQANEMDI